MGHSTIFSHNPQLRYSLTLCEEEKKFIEKRQECVFEKMKAMLGEDAPLSAQEVSKDNSFHHFYICINVHKDKSSWFCSFR